MEVQIESKRAPSSSPSQPSLFVKFLCCLDKGAHHSFSLLIGIRDLTSFCHTATSPRQCTTLREWLPLIITHAHDLPFVESVIRALRLNAYACTPAPPRHTHFLLLLHLTCSSSSRWAGQAFLRCLPASKARSRCSDAEVRQARIDDLCTLVCRYLTYICFFGCA